MRIALVVMLPARDAHAYIDPATGSFLLQLLLASILGALFTIKLWFAAVKRFFRRLTGTTSKTAPAESTTPNADGIPAQDSAPSEARPQGQ